MQNEPPLPQREKLPRRKIASRTGFVAGAVALIVVLALLIFVDPLMNKFVKPRIVAQVTKAYPACTINIDDMSYSIFKNRFGFGSVLLSAVDGEFTIGMGEVSLAGVDWLHLLWARELKHDDFGSAIAEAESVVVVFTEPQYELRCGLVRVSVADSTIDIELLELRPQVDDQTLFARSDFRKSRYRLVVPLTEVMGFACIDLFKERQYHARSARFHDALFDVLRDKYKPHKSNKSSPLMLVEFFASIAGALHVDSLFIDNGNLNYGEQFASGAKPATMTFDKVQVLANGVSNQSNSNVMMIIHAQGRFMNAGTMDVLMTMPVASSELTFQYSGSLSRMNINALNPYLEIANQVRIKAGVLHSATFDIDVVDGHATGEVKAVYRDLTLAVINENTGSDQGFSDGLKSLFANTFKIRGTNVPDESGSMKIGVVDYRRQRDDTFLRFAWQSVLSGVRDVTLY